MWLPGGGEENGVLVLMGIKFSFLKDEKSLEMDGGDSCTKM